MRELPDTEPGQQPAVATACGKLILLGEHSVVYGEPAIALPLTAWRLSVVLGRPEGWQPTLDEQRLPTEVSDGSATLPLPALGTHAQPPLSVDLGPEAPAGAEDDIARALGAAAAALSVSVPMPVRLAVRTGGLRSGLGTSAALGVALSRALLRWHGRQPEPDELLRGAEAVEKLFHHNPSGIDHTVSACEAPVWYVKGKGPQRLQDMPPLVLVLRPRAADRPTAELVGLVRERLVADPGLARTIAEMGRASRQGRAAWKESNWDGLAACMRAQQRGLDRLGVVDEVDRQGIASAEAAGAAAAKVTGAGGGGTLLALVRPSLADQLAAAWHPDAFVFRVG